MNHAANNPEGGHAGPSIGLSAVATALGPRRVSLASLAQAGRLVSDVAALRDFGFDVVHECDASSPWPAGALAMQAATAALREAALRPDQIDLLIWAGARAESHIVPPDDHADADDVLDGFRYAAGRLQAALGLTRAEYLAVAQQGCVAMFSALRLARAVLLSEPQMQHVLCVGVDTLPAGSTREILYNVISDGAAAVVVSRHATIDRWLGYRQVCLGEMWDPRAHRPQILAAYFPQAKGLIEELLAEHGFSASDVDFVVPTGVQEQSWDILLRLIGVPRERLYRGGGSFGHTVCCDNFVHLERLRREADCPAGSKLLLFTYGFGSTWACLLLEH